jgi:hypothetical protein
MDWGIQEVDCRTPLQPVPGVQYHHHDGAGDHIIRLLADQQHLYAIDDRRGLQLLHRPAPGQLQLQGSFVAPEGALWALRIAYALSNDGGAHWYPVEPGERYHFPQPGTDLRWRATLMSTDLLTTPVLETIRIDYTTSEQTGQ